MITRAEIEAAAKALCDFEGNHDEPEVYREMAKVALEAAETPLHRAAPELLEALKEATLALALKAQADGNEEPLKAARAAIAKAEERS